MYNDVLITGAVEHELAGIIKMLSCSAIRNIGRRKIIYGKIKYDQIQNILVRLIITGPGIVNTVQSLTAVIEKKKPDLIIQTGCAGAFKQSGLKIGDIGIASRETYVHLGLEPENKKHLISPLPFSIMQYNGIDITNSYPLDKNLVDQAYTILSKFFGSKKIKIQKGPFITVSTITATDQKAKDLYAQFSPCMEAMEGSGSAHLALHYNIPFLEIRSVSNFVGKRDKKNWNLALAFERCSAGVVELLKNINKFGDNHE